MIFRKCSICGKFRSKTSKHWILCEDGSKKRDWVCDGCLFEGSNWKLDELLKKLSLDQKAYVWSFLMKDSKFVRG